MTHKFYAACLSSYNNGHLHGAWVEISEDKEAMQEEVSAMLAASPIPEAEEWAIHDWDAVKAFSNLGEASDLKQIAEIAQAVEAIESNYDEGESAILLDWVQDCGLSPDEWADKVEDAHAGTHSDPEDFASDLTEETGELQNVPERLRGYIDFKALARDMALNGEIDFICTSTGDHLQSYDDMRGRECIALRTY